MIESDAKIKYVKSALKSKQDYNEIIDHNSFTDSEKDVLLQATANIMHTNTDKFLLYEAYEILVSKVHQNISTIAPKVDEKKIMMPEYNEMIQFVKNVLGSREKYHEAVSNHKFNSYEKDILLRASANIHNSKTDGALINKAYNILVSRVHQDTSTEAIKKYKYVSTAAIDPPNQDINIIERINKIKKKQKLIDSDMIHRYVKNETKSKDILENTSMNNDITKKVDTQFVANDFYLKEGGEMILYEHEKFLDDVLSYKNEPKDEKKSSFAIGLIMVIVFLWWISPSDKKVSDNVSKTSSASSSYREQGSIHGAWAYMQIFVEKRLKSPKSADFPFGGGTNHTKKLGGGRYEVNSYVDSENAFGANIRTHFKGVIKRENGGWVLEYLTFEK